MSKAGKIRIGISGWTYAPWRGVFYPPKLPQKRELAYAAEQFCTIEINGTFYASGYDAEALDDWARRIRAWLVGREPRDATRVAGPAEEKLPGRDVYIYFDNDMKVTALEDAAALAARLGVGP